MKTHVFTGSKAEIAERVAQIDGTIREVIVIVEEPTDQKPLSSWDDMFAEMEPYTVQVDEVDDSRESIYTRRDGE